VVSASRLDEKRHIEMSPEVLDALMALRDFLYEKVYERPEIRAEFERAQRVIRELWEYFNAHGDEFRAKHWPKGLPESEELPRAVADFITGMTDRYAMRTVLAGMQILSPPGAGPPTPQAGLARIR
jgi:dGTPase